VKYAESLSSEVLSIFFNHEANVNILRTRAEEVVSKGASTATAGHRLPNMIFNLLERVTFEGPYCD
jgi:hypothetical protein